MQKNEQSKLKIILLLDMMVFGVMGPIVRAIGLPSPVIACSRAWIAGVVLTLYMILARRPFDKDVMRKVLPALFVSGFCMAISWIGLFEAYNYTTVATATVGFYLAPVLVFLVSPAILKESFTAKHLICALVAFFGMVLVSGIFESGAAGEALNPGTFKGILFALLGATGYATSILVNKKQPEGDPIARTTIQFFVAAIATTPYVLLRYPVTELEFTPKGILLLLFLGIFLTAVTYIVYFSIVVKIPARTVAILSYADPVTSVMVSVFFLGEKITVPGILGVILIIGAAVISELSPSPKPQCKPQK